MSCVDGDREGGRQRERREREEGEEAMRRERTPKTAGGRDDRRTLSQKH